MWGEAGRKKGVGDWGLGLCGGLMPSPEAPDVPTAAFATG